MTSGFDLGHDLDLEFSRSNVEFAISQPKMVRLPRNEKQTYRLNSGAQMWPMVWIYQIVTGVTSVVGVPSTHLVASDNGLSPGWRQAFIWNNGGILSIGLLGTNFSEILIEILTFSFKKMSLKVSSAKWRPFCLGFNEFVIYWTSIRTESASSRYFLSSTVLEIRNETIL